jgi:hypothetical protein
MPLISIRMSYCIKFAFSRASFSKNYLDISRSYSPKGLAFRKSFALIRHKFKSIFLPPNAAGRRLLARLNSYSYRRASESLFNATATLGAQAIFQFKWSITCGCSASAARPMP